MVFSCSTLHITQFKHSSLKVWNLKHWSSPDQGKQMLLKWHPLYVAKAKQVSGRPRKWPTHTHPKTQSCNGWPTPGGKYTVSGIQITFWCSLSLANNPESSDQCFYIIWDNKLQLLQFGNSYGEPGGWLATVRKTRTDHRSYYATGQRSGGVLLLLIAFI